MVTLLSALALIGRGAGVKNGMIGEDAFLSMMSQLRDQNLGWGEREEEEEEEDSVKGLIYLNRSTAGRFNLSGFIADADYPESKNLLHCRRFSSGCYLVIASEPTVLWDLHGDI